MKCFAKLIEGVLCISPSPIRTDEGDIFSNDPDVLARYGYKPVIFTTYPEDDEAYYVSEWAESETAITQTWKAAERPATPQAILNIITGGEA